VNPQMKKADLVELLQNDTRNKEVCTELVDAIFEELASQVNLENSLSIEGIGHLGAHRRRGANKELPNEEGLLSQKNLSIFFHPEHDIKEQVTEYVEETAKD